MLLASCHSSRNSTVKTGRDATVVERVSKDKSSTKGSKSDNDVKVANALVKEANKWLGVPYRYGGKSRSGTDCSGFVMTIFNDVADVKLPRDSRSQEAYCRHIDAKNMQPGDLVFFSGKGGGSSVGHVGMYVGDNSIIHASTSRGVIISNLDENYYKNHYYSSGRVEAITYAATGGKVKETKVQEPQLAYAEPTKSEKPKKSERPKKEKAKTKPEKVIAKSEPEPVEIAAAPIVKVNGKITVQPKPRVHVEPEPADTTASIISGWMD